ncbi:ABC transporter substrate-binding protein [Altericroceibacterium spongiae]|uniref:ABC transporter substrate-binding protein n=1 Tax=Altericroceibacterium spongiae TaxID=2320269 RepID=A0A420EA90_9SPHN|nr:ABC transporter substrate-binding protein [Altericroceibacterium spongiae]RKF17603.1 ABC transporter substrate-binding protein [Altericroceibacterium spongiae]
MPSPAPNRNKSVLLGAAVLVALALLAILMFWQGGEQKDGSSSSAPAELTDISGRPITIDGPVQSIAIDDSRYLVALGLIHPDPVSLLAAWPKDVNRLGTDTYQRYLAKSPELADLPVISSSAGNFNMEALLAAAPDVALLSLESGISDAQIDQLEAAGIHVVIVDFFVKPFDNLEPSLRILGKLTGREQQAEDFIAFRAEHMKRIADAVAKLPASNRPKVFLEAHAGISNDCCNSPGRGNIGDYIDFVGGHNIGADVISQSFGKLNLEYVIAQDPKVYITTGGPHLAKAGGLVLGPEFTPEEARASLAKVAERRGISGLSAVASGNTHGFSHQLINSPLDIVAIETFAKWIHPEVFPDIDPAQTLETINNRFLAVPYDGTYWVDLP